MGIKGVLSANKVIDPPLKIAIIGDPGVGKSWFANTIDGFKYDFDFDGRASSLITHPKAADINVKTYYDSDPNKPNAIQEFERDLAVLKYAKSQGKLPPDFTSIIDSLTFARKACEDELIRQQGNLSRKLRIGTTTVNIPAGWDVINAVKEYLEYIVAELATLGNLICVFHEKDEKDVTTSTESKTTYTGMTTIQPQYLNLLLSIFNDVWRLSVNSNGKRNVQTGIGPQFVGKCTLLGIDPLVQEPDIAAMLRKHKAELVKKLPAQTDNVVVTK